MNLKQYKKKWESRRYFGTSQLINAVNAANHAANCFNELAKFCQKVAIARIFIRCQK